MIFDSLNQALSNLVRPAVASIILLGPSLTASAFNYHELEVYPWRTEGAGVVEVENSYLISSGDKNSNGENTYRNSLEINAGITDWLEFAIYNDFAQYAQDDEMKYTATRVRTHMSFAEKNQYPVDVGAYFEVALPKQGDDQPVVYEVEGKLILEKDVGRMTFVLNPTLEVEREKEQEVTADGSVKDEYEMEFETAYSAAAQWRVSDSFLPALNVFDNLKGADERVVLVYPTIDYSFSRLFKAGIGVGYGLTRAAEKRLVNTKLEFEF